MSNVAIIPARAGSKGIKDKNIIDFCGKPLIVWTILQAIDSGVVDDVYVSTDGDRIARIAESYGARIIWRPKDIASDIASSEDALIHALCEIEKKTIVDNIVFLQATSPLRRSSQIKEAMGCFLENSYDSMFSATILEDYCIWKKNKDTLESFSYDYTARGRRQDREPLYLENGSFYIMKPEILKKLHNRLGGKIGIYNMPFDMSYEIDSMEDVDICAYFFKKYQNSEV